MNKQRRKRRLGQLHRECVEITGIKNYSLEKGSVECKLLLLSRGWDYCYAHKPKGKEWALYHKKSYCRKKVVEEYFAQLNHIDNPERKMSDDEAAQNFLLQNGGGSETISYIPLFCNGLAKTALAQMKFHGSVLEEELFVFKIQYDISPWTRWVHASTVDPLTTYMSLVAEGQRREQDRAVS